MMIRTIPWFLLLVIPWFVCHAQEELIMEEITGNLVESDQEQQSWYLRETVSTLLDDPLDINHAGEGELQECGLFTPYQVYGILTYREKYGALLTLYELVTIPGFSADYVRHIEPLLTLDKVQNQPPAGWRGEVLNDLSRKFPRSAAYLSPDTVPPDYKGPPGRMKTRVNIERDERWSGGLAYEKDPGEECLYSFRPEHVTGYIRYRGKGVLKKLAAGCYKVQHGLGLVHGMGMNQSASAFELKGYRTAMIRPYASTAENTHQSGLAAQIDLGTWLLQSFVSTQWRDLSFHGLHPPGERFDLIDAIREPGLHRTDGERSGRRLARDHRAGFSLNRQGTRFNAGIAISAIAISLSQKARDSVPYADPGPQWAGNATGYLVGFTDRMDYFAEAAIDREGDPACLAGLKYRFNAALATGLSFRHYDPGYRAPQANSHSAGSEVSNETGLTANWVVHPLHHLTLVLFTDLTFRPGASWYQPWPSLARHTGLKAAYRFGNDALVHARFRTKEHEEAVERGTSGAGASRRTGKRSFRVHLDYPVTEQVKISSRVAGSLLQGKALNEAGWLVYQQVALSFGVKWGIRYRFLLFDIAEWDNRIYCYEPGVKYSFYFPSYYGTGMKSNLAFSWKPCRRLTVRGRLAAIRWAHKKETGSGYDIRPGNRVIDAVIQVQVKW